MPALTTEQLKRIAVDAARTYGIPEAFFLALITQESSWQTDTVSPAGARGIAQFMPETAKSLGINPDNPAEALYGAAKHLADLTKHYGYVKDGDAAKNKKAVEFAAAAYNAGQGAVDRAIDFSTRKFMGIDGYTQFLPEETKNYLKILKPSITGEAGGEAESPYTLGQRATAALTGQKESEYTDFSRPPTPAEFKHEEPDGTVWTDWDGYASAMAGYKANIEAKAMDREYNLGPLSQYVEDVMVDISNQIATGQLSLTKANSLFQAKLDSYKMATEAYESKAFAYGAPADAAYIPTIEPGSYNAGLRGSPASTQGMVVMNPLQEAMRMFKEAEAAIGAVNVPTVPNIAAMRSGFGGPGQYGPPPPDRLADQAASPSYHSEPEDLMEEALRKIREAGGIG